MPLTQAWLSYRERVGGSLVSPLMMWLRNKVCVLKGMHGKKCFFRHLQCCFCPPSIYLLLQPPGKQRSGRLPFCLRDLIRKLEIMIASMPILLLASSVQIEGALFCKKQCNCVHRCPSPGFSVTPVNLLTAHKILCTLTILPLTSVCKEESVSVPDLQHFNQPQLLLSIPNMLFFKPEKGL